MPPLLPVTVDRHCAIGEKAFRVHSHTEAISTPVTDASLDVIKCHCRIADDLRNQLRELIITGKSQRYIVRWTQRGDCPGDKLGREGTLETKLFFQSDEPVLDPQW